MADSGEHLVLIPTRTTYVWNTQNGSLVVVVSSRAEQARLICRASVVWVFFCYLPFRFNCITSPLDLTVSHTQSIILGLFPGFLMLFFKSRNN